MILIALSKKSHTFWRIIDKHKKIQQYQTLSLNSFFHTFDFHKVAKNQLPDVDYDKVTQMYFYSSECDSDIKCHHIGDFLKSIFKHASISINDDLIAVGRGLCGTDKGIVAILGSGSSSGLYDGKKITSTVHTEDMEGSSYYFGKQLITDYLNKALPKDLEMLFVFKYKPGDEEFKESVNKSTLKEKEFLASLGPFLFHNINHPYVSSLVYRAFDKFLEKYILVYDGHTDLKVHCAGAVAFYYGNILREVANDKGVFIASVVENPVAGLALYHAENE